MDIPLRVVAIIQARMGSTRLPGKVLMDLAGEPMLARVVNRTMRAKRLNETIVATTVNSEDDQIASLCQGYSWPLFRGSAEDVLDRYYKTAQLYRADVVVRITCDCPLIDPGIIDTLVQTFLGGHWDYVSNTLPPQTFPRGLDVEVMSFAALERAWREDTNLLWREHMTPYIYRHPELFRLYSVKNESDLSFMRWTVDTEEDLAFVRKIYVWFGHDAFSWREVLVSLEEHPEWLEINRHVVQKDVP